MTMRTATVGDAAGLMLLWEASGLRFDSAIVGSELAGALERNPLVLVEVDDAGAIVGSVFGTFDGRRGWANRLAVRPAMRGRGIASGLLAELERRLRALGCPKVNLLVESDNCNARAMYEKLGYQGRELTFMTKRLAPRWSRDLSPALSDEPYVFASVDSAAPGVPMFAAILEDEGLTLVLTKADAEMAKLSYSYVAGRITLGVESSLDEIGLTARVSRALADAEISCNVIAGSAHDHLFVDWALRFRALDLLRSLLPRGQPALAPTSARPLRLPPAPARGRSGAWPLGRVAAPARACPRAPAPARLPPRACPRAPAPAPARPGSGPPRRTGHLVHYRRGAGANYCGYLPTQFGGVSVHDLPPDRRRAMANRASPGIAGGPPGRCRPQAGSMRY